MIVNNFIMGILKCPWANQSIVYRFLNRFEHNLARKWVGAFLTFKLKLVQLVPSRIKSIFYFYLKVEDTFMTIKTKGEDYENRTDSSYQYVEI